MEERRPLFRIAELFFLFGTLPLVLLWDVLPRPWVVYLLIVAIPVIVWLRSSRRFPWGDFWSGPPDLDFRSARYRVISRFGVNSIAIVVFMLFLFPNRLLSFPSEDPLRWLAVLIFYPLTMVYPQELVFRVFFAERYAGILGSRKWLGVINGLLFGWVHILYGNWVAVVLSGVGGFLLMDTYVRTRSVKLLWLEHSLYGNLIFTVGLGEFFYSGWAG